MTVSKYYRHKNIHLIRPIVEELKRRGIHDIQFILTIDKSEYDTLFEDKYLDEILTVGPVPVDECPSLYYECNAVFLPTLLECFSANYPEAMAIQKPILTSDLGFARSICQDAALYFDPSNVYDIVDKIILLYKSPDIQEQLITVGNRVLKTFPTSTQRAEKYLRICKNLFV